MSDLYTERVIRKFKKKFPKINMDYQEYHIKQMDHCCGVMIISGFETIPASEYNERTDTRTFNRKAMNYLLELSEDMAKAHFYTLVVAATAIGEQKTQDDWRKLFKHRGYETIQTFKSNSSGNIVRLHALRLPHNSGEVEWED